ncbi:hypothetical protein [Streptomyces sp. HYC2]|uniref:hypothetical protein n=1 Tax=Streptomyces sp. HYC2 TaxID=2955207 RepID=UPI002481904F|nr:hypothetical protein [Streptomyces sp. HYC2]
MLFPSALRTLVPMLAGWAITVLSGLGLHADSTTVAGGITVAVAACYYLLFRIVERLAEKMGGPAWLLLMVGLLLGYARPPQYESGDDIEALIRASRR